MSPEKSTFLFNCSFYILLWGQVTRYFFWVVFFHNSKGENETEPLNPSETTSDRDSIEASTFFVRFMDPKPQNHM